jgi:DNA-binding response OmpR family regulator
MHYEEERVLSFLKEYPETAFSRREIARKAVKRREFEADPEWANVAISNLLDRKEIEEDKAGCYRLNPKSHVW